MIHVALVISQEIGKDEEEEILKVEIDMIQERYRAQVLAAMNWWDKCELPGKKESQCPRCFFVNHFSGKITLGIMTCVVLLCLQEIVLYGNIYKTHCQIYASN